ncbi:lipase chaperone [Phycicoccus sp. Root101]|uniref:lipase chaperone n=1 Tax=Phycicoccus sp. Root101 TaxID=1736421 RepID=UPI0007034E69|nr:lipase chaperone [Phycicoccus sp. Root101]KQU67427.1 hypothetical protein ASC58_12705 [Phycicoccus sp. Root101]
MSRRTGTVVAAVALWLAIVASTSTVAWIVIDRAGRGAYLTDGARPELTQAGPGTTTTDVTEGTVSATSSVPSSTSPPTSSAGRPPTTSRPARTTPSHSAPAPRSTVPSPAVTPPRTGSRPSSTPRPAPRTSASSPVRPQTVDDSISVTGGSVGVSCRGTTLTLRFATPRNGWSYELDRSSTEIEVQFRQNGSEQESEVHARCSGGAPVFETSSSDGGSERSSGTATPDD